MRNESRISIWDFDGTFTDLTQNEGEFRDTYHNLLAKRLNIPKNEIHELMASVESKILRQPGMFGWEHKGFVIAPSLSLPLLLKTAAIKVLHTLREN